MIYPVVNIIHLSNNPGPEVILNIFELRSCNSLSSFKSKLKTWLFKIGYDVV